MCGYADRYKAMLRDQKRVSDQEVRKGWGEPGGSAGACGVLLCGVLLCGCWHVGNCGVGSAKVWVDFHSSYCSGQGRYRRVQASQWLRDALSGCRHRREHMRMCTDSWDAACFRGPRLKLTERCADVCIRLLPTAQASDLDGQAVMPLYGTRGPSR